MFNLRITDDNEIGVPTLIFFGIHVAPVLNPGFTAAESPGGRRGATALPLSRYPMM
jgi:hypothetical protein